MRRRRNFEHNSRIEHSGGLVCGQRLEPVCNFRFGARNFGSCGCGVIAFANALALCGCEISLANAAYELEPCAMFGGRLGVNPFLYPRRLRGYGIKARSLSVKRAEKSPDGSVFIIAYFLKKRIGRAHIVAAVKENGGITVYNNTGRNPSPVRYSSFKEISGGGWFIVCFLLSKVSARF